MQNKDRFSPSELQVNKLIEYAQQHPLGLDFLNEGYLESVAITFQTHVFTVEAARKKLSSGQRVM